MEAPPQPVRRARQRGIEFALADREGADEVALELVMDDGRARTQCRLGVHHRRQRIEIDGHQLGCILGCVAALRHDDGHRLADVPDLVVRQERLLWIDEIMPHQARPFPGKRELRVRHRRQQPCEIGTAQDKGDATRRCGARQVDGADARMRDGAPHEHRVQHVRQIEIGNEMASAREQTAILPARQRTPDEKGLAIIVHARTVIPAETMFRLASRCRSCLRSCRWELM
jgi:hypothetical protein